MITKLIPLFGILISFLSITFNVDNSNNIEVIKTNIIENEDINYEGFLLDYTAFKDEGFEINIPITGTSSSYRSYEMELEIYQEGLEVVDKNILSSLSDKFTYQDHVIKKTFKKLIPYSYIKKDFSIKVKCVNEYLAEFSFTTKVSNRNANNTFSTGVIKQYKKSYIKNYVLYEEIEKLDFSTFTGLFDCEYYFRFNNKKLSFAPSSYFSINEVVVQFLDENNTFNKVLKGVEVNGNDKYKEYYLIPEYINNNFIFNNASFYYLDETSNKMSLIKDDMYSKKVTNIHFPYENLTDFSSLEMIFNFVGVSEGQYCFNIKKTLSMPNKLLKDSFSISKTDSNIEELIEMERVNL